MLLVVDNVTMAAPSHSRSALIFLIAAIVAALVSIPVLRAVGMVQWPVFVIAWLINLGAAWHLAQWARQQALALGVRGTGSARYGRLDRGVCAAGVAGAQGCAALSVRGFRRQRAEHGPALQWSG